MIRLHLKQSELTYEGSFVKPVFSLIDTPGKLCDLLLGALETFGVTSADLLSEEGEPGERGMTCEVDDFEARVTIRGDRVELYCSDFVRARVEKITTVLERLWLGLTSLSAGAAPRMHSFLFEMDFGIDGHSYQEILDRLARAPNSLPPGTETAVVYYLPAESGRGYGESSIVLNRSVVVERGLQVNTTLVSEGDTIRSAAMISIARERLIELLRNLGLEWTED